MSEDDLRQRILDAAEACLLDIGPSARFHGQIAQRAGVSRPSVYKYGGDQQAIVEALLHREVDRYLKAVEPVLSRRGPLREQFVETVVFTVGYARDHALLQTLLRDLPQVVLPWLTTDAEPMLRRGLAAMTSYVKRGEPAPEVEPTVVVEWGIRLVVSLITTPSTTQSLNKPADLYRYVAALLAIGSDPLPDQSG